jgi:aryl-alcohol dehydrogenase-like predicted oxidoreductase
VASSTQRSDADPVGRRFFGDGDRSIIDGVLQVAEARGIPMAQVALAWVLKNPVVAAPLVGATKPHHLADAVAALDIRLTDYEVRSLKEPYTPRRPAGL